MIFQKRTHPVSLLESVAFFESWKAKAPGETGQLSNQGLDAKCVLRKFRKRMIRIKPMGIGVVANQVAGVCPLTHQALSRFAIDVFATDKRRDFQILVRAQRTEQCAIALLGHRFGSAKEIEVINGNGNLRRFGEARSGSASHYEAGRGDCKCLGKLSAIHEFSSYSGAMMPA
jgi:hypothetical protein